MLLFLETVVDRLVETGFGVAYQIDTGSGTSVQFNNTFFEIDNSTVGNSMKFKSFSFSEGDVSPTRASLLVDWANPNRHLL